MHNMAKDNVRTALLIDSEHSVDSSISYSLSSSGRRITNVFI